MDSFLVELARRDHDTVAVSIFVNPRQFAAHEDFGTYPRTLDADVAEYVVQAPLVCIVTEAWFDAADLDGDGRLTLDELERMFAAHGAGDAAAARRAFVAYDGDLSGFIDKPEYQRLLLGEHLLSVTTPSGGSIRPTPRL